MKTVSLDYFLFRKNFPEEALKLEKTSEEFERKKKLDLERQLHQNAEEEESHANQANRYYEAEIENPRS